MPPLTVPVLAVQLHLPSLLATLGIWLVGHCSARQPLSCCASDGELDGMTHAMSGLDMLGAGWASGPGRTRTPPFGGL